MLKIIALLPFTALIANNVFAIELLWTGYDDRSRTINCEQEKCHAFPDNIVKRFNIEPLGVTYTNKSYTVLYQNSEGDYCVKVDDPRNAAFYIKANQGVKRFTKADIGVATSCPPLTVMLERDYYGEILDAKQLVVFSSNKASYGWTGKVYDGSLVKLTEPSFSLEKGLINIEQSEPHVNRMTH